MKISIPGKSLTKNHIYGFRGFHKFLTKEGKEEKAHIINQVNKQISQEERKAFLDKKIILKAYLFENWLTKKGSIARKDVANREKFLIDCIFEALGLDDKQIWEHRLYKRQG